MVAIAGAWKAKQGYNYANKWGNGVNPIHALPYGEGRNIANHPNPNPPVPEYMTDPYVASDWVGYVDEESSTIWGSGAGTGTDVYPNWGEDSTDNSKILPDYPSWGHRGGTPGGQRVRSINRGAANTLTAKETPNETVSEGWLNKVHDEEPYDSDVSDVSQIYMQTSMTQRDKVREGSQRGMGSANEFDSPIKSRIPGARLRYYSGNERHYDMEPKAQEEIIRGFLNRHAGTGRVEELGPNAMFVNQSLQRTPPESPYHGPGVENASYQGTDPSGYAHGFMSEDVLW